jgi:Zn-finger nucleic acid-binding protein
MDTYPYGGSGNIIIQGCHHCKWIWLDFEELSRIIHYYVPPHNHETELYSYSGEDL